MVCVDGGLYVVQKDTAGQKTMSFYDTKGDEKQVWKEIPEYESIAATKDEVVFFSPQRVTVYRVNGSVKFGKSFTQSLEAIFPAGNNRYFLVDMGKVQTIKLSDESNSETKED